MCRSICRPASIAVFLLIGHFASAADNAAETTFPYKARVAVDDVYVRSGPGQSYYPTDKLKLGEVVEVYRHDPGGWYAIRPPKDSFTWISARYLDARRDDLGVITEENVAARVGSNFSGIRDVIQVRLHQGEVVELRGEDRRAAADPSNERWVRIAPPAGEFRWVYGRYIDAEYPADGLSRPSAKDGIAANDASAASTTAAGDAQEAATAAAAPRQVSADGFLDELEAIELELSVMVAEEPGVWTFDDLQRRSDALLKQADTAVERGQARALLSKIERFDDVRRRFARVAAMRDETDLASRLLSGVAPLGAPAAEAPPPAAAFANGNAPPRDAISPSGAAARREAAAARSAIAEGRVGEPAAPADNERYDGRGRLAEVAAPTVGAPRFALVNGQGAVTSYVTPAPGVNLRRYLGRQVGITGTRGYLNEKQAPNLMARHITALDGPQLR